MSRDHDPYKTARHAPEMDVRGASTLEDFAFADTVVVADLDEPVFSSAILVSDDTGLSHCVLAVALPPAAVDLSVTARARRAWARVRYGANTSWREVQLLWSATARVERLHDGTAVIVKHDDPFVRAATVGRRLWTLLSFFEWDRTNLLRGAWIGLAVLVLAATVGAVVLQIGSPPNTAHRSVPATSSR